MGIQGLLGFLKPVVSRVNLEQYAGQRVGVDCMGWLHRGAVSDALDLLQGKYTTGYLKFFAKMIKVLLDENIQPVLVFAGADLPWKRHEDANQQARRDLAAEEARALIKDDPHNEHEIHAKACAAINITRPMVERAIALARYCNLLVVVAPYEADAQLAYMARMGYIRGVITEDSDFLMYGTPRIIYKLEKDGFGDHVNIGKLYDLPKDLADKDNEPEFSGPLAHLNSFTLDMFTDAGVLAGCDYTRYTKIKGLGIHTAFSLIYEHKTIAATFQFLENDPTWTSRIPETDNIFEIYLGAAKVFRMEFSYDLLTESVVPVGASQPGPLLEPNSFEKAMMPEPISPFKDIAEGIVNFNGDKIDTELNDKETAIAAEIEVLGTAVKFPLSEEMKESILERLKEKEKDDDDDDDGDKTGVKSTKKGSSKTKGTADNSSPSTAKRPRRAAFKEASYGDCS